MTKVAEKFDLVDKRAHYEALEYSNFKRENKLIQRALDDLDKPKEVDEPNFLPAIVKKSVDPLYPKKNSRINPN